MHPVPLERTALPAAARRAVADACRDARTGPECLDSAVLMTSEVVTNALLHGRGEITLSVGADSALVRVEVGDDAVAAPSPRHAQADAESGRGMQIVESLSARWGVLPSPVGKLVWFEVPAQP